MADLYSPIEVPDVWAHVTTRWPESTPFMQCAKVAEEAGEAVGEAIKLSQLRGGDVLDELADTIIAAIGALQSLGQNPRFVVAERWEEVMNR